MNRMVLFFLIIGFAGVVHADEFNVAQAKWGASATASSIYGQGYAADNAVDGKWSARETDKWNSAAGDGPHWLCVDLGTERVVHKIVIRHEGVLAEGEKYNTAAFRLQKGESDQGPWVDLIEPVRGNKSNITTHVFDPVKTRFVRLFIQKAEQKGNTYGRVFEIEVYSSTKDITEYMLSMSFPERKFRRQNGDFLVKAECEVVRPASAQEFATVKLRSNGKDLGHLSVNTGAATDIYVPAKAAPCEVQLVGVYESGTEEVLASQKINPPVPTYFDNGGTIHVVSSSHQDIAWMDSPQFCREWRDENNMTPALEMMQKDEDYRFTVESMMYLMDELEDHPERRELVHKLTKNGQLEWGATYTQPYESSISGEQMIRGMYLGRKWFRKTFPDCDAVVAWNPDVPGRSMQMPQIMHKAGIKYLMFSRHEKGLYEWLSPDGTGVIAFSPGHYGDDHFKIFTADSKTAISRINQQLTEDGEYFDKRNIDPEYCLLNSVDFSEPTDFSQIMQMFNDQAADRFETNGDESIAAKMKYSGATEFFEKVTKNNPDLKVITGERPNVWLYIHGPAHHKALSAGRAAGRVLPAAEMFSTIECLLDGDFEDYPEQEFFDAWKAACFPDHGWGGNKGKITDALFKEKLEYARDKGQAILDRTTRKIASHVKTDETRGKPLVVFNSLSWKRSDIVKTKIDGLAEDIRIVDADGKSVPHQMLPCDEYGKSEIMFAAEDVPSLGYSTYYIAVGKEEFATDAVASEGTFENAFYKGQLSSGGIKNIYDKELGRDVLQSEKFLAGEVFTMQSVGNGAGEFTEVQQPTMEGFDKSSNHGSKWTLIEAESGPVQTVYESEQKFSHCTVRQRIIFYNPVKRIDFEVSLLGWDGTKSREFRMALPVDMKDGKVAYEVPMGVLEVGKDEIEGAAGGHGGGGYYTQVCKDVRPREVQNFITANDQNFGVTMSSSVAVCDWVDPTDDPGDYPILQPILLASRKSCHWLGPWYLQEGDHHYRFSVLSHEAGWENGYRFGIAANTPLHVVAAKPRPNANLPEEKSFFAVSAPNVQVSTIKKCDDDDSVVVRLYDIEGKDSNMTLNTFFEIAGAEHTNIIEEEGTPVPAAGKMFESRIGDHAIETFKFLPE
ncbi:Mannosylglycerate hydrolase [Anaerohalosphaera lusitana]|uniref:Mannosylglycerate hydrolase n=1 Tax=Anaerohalosphaera lusitana TaxID=1936003 RepID=A0A1U9NLE9_9BACT|nr:discoidin domain-containing protein [Anaerohalosphaera lusitana]AQT68763.1 Mannosylglycerate hydrolase [Anaerohalosphaera lusitana]